MLKELLHSNHVYYIFKTIFEQGRSYFTLSQLIKPYALDQGNTTRYLKKLSTSGLITKLDGSAVYVIDRNNLTVLTLFNLIKLEQLSLTCSPDQHIFLKYEKYFRNQPLHHSRVEGAPFFLSIVCEAEQRDEERKRGAQHKFMPYLMCEGHIDRYLSYNDLHHTTQLLLEAAQRGDTRYLQQRLDERAVDNEVFLEQTTDLENIDIATRSMSRTIHQLTTYIQNYIAARSRSSILEACRFDTIPTIIQTVHDSIQKNTSADRNPGTEEIRSIITAPSFFTYIDEAKYRLIEIAQEIQHHYPDVYTQLTQEYDCEHLTTQIRSTMPFLAETLTIFMQQHYQGISFAAVRRYDMQDIFSIISKRYVHHTDLQGLRETMKEKKHQIREQKKRLLATVGDDLTTVTLLGFMDDILRMKDVSTRGVLHLHYHGIRLLEAIAAHKHCDSTTLLRMSYDEVLLFCHDLHTPDTAILQQRITYSLCIQKDHRYYFYLGDEAKRLHALLLKDSTTYFTGMRGAVRNEGIAVGKVWKPGHTPLHAGDIVIAASRNDLKQHSLDQIGALLLERNEKSPELYTFIQSHPSIPVIVHVDGLSQRLQENDILHIDGHTGRITVLQQQLMPTYTTAAAIAQKHISPTKAIKKAEK